MPRLWISESRRDALLRQVRGVDRRHLHAVPLREPAWLRVLRKMRRAAGELAANRKSAARARTPLLHAEGMFVSLNGSAPAAAAGVVESPRNSPAASNTTESVGTHLLSRSAWIGSVSEYAGSALCSPWLVSFWEGTGLEYAPPTTART